MPTPPTAIFSAWPDWSSPVSDKLSYLTNVLTAADDSEQRIQLRGLPNRFLSWSVLGMTPRESATIDAMLYSQQGSRVGVPLWPEVSVLTAAASIGATSIAADTTYRSFGAVSYALLWLDMWTYEMATVNTGAVTDSTIALSSGTVKAWPAGTVVTPLLVGHHSAKIARTRPSRDTGRVSVAFAVEVVQ